MIFKLIDEKFWCKELHPTDFKDEVDYKNCKTFEELVEKIDEYVYYYNNERYQWCKLKISK